VVFLFARFFMTTIVRIYHFVSPYVSKKIGNKPSFFHNKGNRK
jgi:hypothetical protein